MACQANRTYRAVEVQAAPGVSGRLRHSVDLHGLLAIIEIGQGTGPIGWLDISGQLTGIAKSPSHKIRQPLDVAGVRLQVVEVDGSANGMVDAAQVRLRGDELRAQ